MKALLSLNLKQFNQKSVFNNAPIRRLAVSMNTNSAVAAFFHEINSTTTNFIGKRLEIFGTEEQLFH